MKFCNIDGTDNVGESVTYKVEANIYFQKYVEHVQIDICNLGQTNLILEILWLVTYNPEINWRAREMKLLRYLY